jgi:SAM-dependent methyltransferase
MTTTDRLYPPRWHHARVILEELRETLGPIGRSLEGDLAIDFGSGTSPYRGLFEGYDRYLTADLPGLGADLEVREGIVPMESGSADLVLSTQVLEHVPEPREYLREARRILTASGVLPTRGRRGPAVLSTHGHYRYHPDPEDYWRWTEPGLRLTLEDAGFAVRELHGVVSGLGASLTMFGQLVGGQLPKPVRALFQVLAQAFIAMIERVARRRHRDDSAVYVVVAVPDSADTAD